MNNRGRLAVTPGIVFGSIAILIGAFLLLRNFGVIQHSITADIFPLLLIVFGLVNLFGRSCSSGRVWGVLLTLFGGYWLASNLGLVPYRLRDIWPAFLILLGLYFLWRALTRKGQTIEAVSNSTLDETAIFGGGKKSVASQQFQGGEVYALCGGHEINLKEADIAQGTAVIEATAILGGIELRVPENWDVAIEGVAIFGGYEDKTSHPREEQAPRRLIVRGFAILGGVEVKN